MQLAEQTCAACDSSAKPLSDVAIEQLLAELQGWQLEHSSGIKKLAKVFTVKDFSAAVAYAQAIAELANQHDHHPALVVEWGRITVQWWTHSINGLHKNDFIMAAKTDALVQSL